MKIRIQENGFTQQAEILRKCIAERIPPESEEGKLSIALCADQTLGAQESYLITREEDGWKITGADSAGLFYGIGKFLHSAKWTEDTLEPNPPTNLVTPACGFRAIYFAVHFYNWYHMAPTGELENYLKELLLWGYNAVICIIPIINLDTFDEALFFDSVEKTRTIFKLAKKLSMKVGIICVGNQGLKSAPAEYNADLSYDPTGKFRGHLGRNLCPSKPGVLDYMKRIWMTTMEQYQDIGLDYLITWPYDEGGCGCARCKPWGGNGYSELVLAFREESIKLYPNAKFIISAWLFDTPDNQGEYESLYPRLRNDLSFADFILVDAHDKFPRYPLEHEAVKPIINFPEISMWKVYPWGGRGANPMPKRFQGFWDETKHILKGGMPYSEGIYDDIMKIQCVGYYWEPDRRVQSILCEYINYEYSGEVCGEALEIMELIEKNHVAVAALREPDINAANRAAELAVAVEKRLSERAKKSWRWRILYIRAQIDKMVYAYYSNVDMSREEALYECRHTPEHCLAGNAQVQALLQELCGYYHCVDSNGENEATLPPVEGGKVKR
ncbi:MAG: glycoside hydrolase family 20 zincin-like fold domain-containing protein [Oscillospiraceae bacterium]|nr:glycoside hydrolase family 20 zincin-like fold domain-containing protein [Oscillospiraceae bacterium]